MKICVNKNSENECLKRAHCNFQWVIPELAGRNNEVIDPVDFLGAYHDNITVEPCAPNAWLWVVDTSEEGEVHFVVGNNIINNVSL